MAILPPSQFDPTTKIWSGPKLIFSSNKKESVGQIIFSSLAEHPKNVLQINETEHTTLTNEEVLNLSKRIALKLIDLGLTSKDFIGIMALNTTYLMPVFYGSLFVNIPCNPVDVSFTKEAVSHLWSKTKPKLVFCDGNVYGVVKEVIEELKLKCEIITMNKHVQGVQKIDDLLSSQHIAEDSFSALEIENEDQLAVILCSSGSTGLSKAVTISNKFCTEMCRLFLDTKENISLITNSLYWLTGLLSILSAGVTGATNLVVSESFNPDIALDLIDKYKVTNTYFSPSNIALVLNSPNIKLKVLSTGGAKFPIELRSRIKQKLSPDCKIYYSYGCSEIGLASFQLTEKKLDSSGFLLFNTEMKIVDENEKNLSSNEDGEIVFRSNNNWQGYYGDRNSSDEVYDSESRWYRTGDLGHFDEEGYLYIVDRKKEIFKSLGTQISPCEIEEVILEIPEVSDVCVVGIDDVVAINLPAALIVKKTQSILSEDTVQKYVAEKMPYYKHLTGGVYFIDSIPKTPSGKMLRRVAREKVEQLYLASKLNI
uniref:AMP-dependent synthetase/ligase domain-containing protein n=1 Tax=Megaselia scalaris TaxID=36166 RepID=T1GF90_MEGSC